MIMARASSTEKRLARIYYVEHGRTAKDIADILGRKPGTVGNWVQNGNWREERNARMFSNDARIREIKEIISNCASERIALAESLKEAQAAGDAEAAKAARVQMVGLSDEVAKWNKTLQTLQSADRVTLAQRLAIQDELFTKLRQALPGIYKEHILPFEERMLQEVIQMYD